MRMEVDWTLLLLPPSPKGHRKKRKRVPRKKLEKDKKHKKERKQVPFPKKEKLLEQKKTKIKKVRSKKQKLKCEEQQQGKGEEAKL